MTTLAYKDGYLAADTQSTDSFGLKARVNKIFDVGVGYAAFTGSYAGAVAWHRALPTEMLTDAVALVRYGYPDYSKETNDTGGLLVLHTGLCFKLDGKIWLPIHEPFCASGSGRDFAIMAMCLGRSAADAVRETMKFDTYTGGDVEVRRVG